MTLLCGLKNISTERIYYRIVFAAFCCSEAAAMAGEGFRSGSKNRFLWLRAHSTQVPTKKIQSISLWTAAYVKLKEFQKRAPSRNWMHFLCLSVLHAESLWTTMHHLELFFLVLNVVLLFVWFCFLARLRSPTVSLDCCYNQIGTGQIYVCWSLSHVLCLFFIACNKVAVKRRKITSRMCECN